MIRSRFGDCVVVAAMSVGGALCAATRVLVLRSHNQFFYRRLRQRIVDRAEEVSDPCGDLEVYVARLFAGPMVRRSDATPPGLVPRQ